MRSYGTDRGIWEVELTCFGRDSAIGAAFARAWSDALASEPAVIEILRAEVIPTRGEHKTSEQSEYWARTVLAPPLGRVYLSLTASTQDHAEALAADIASRTEWRVLQKVCAGEDPPRLAYRARATPSGQ